MSVSPTENNLTAQRSPQLVPSKDFTQHEHYGFAAPTEYKRKLKSAIHHDSDSKRKADKHGFQKRIAFDTVDNKLASDYSLTLRTKHDDYEYDRLTRTILVGVDESKYSKAALVWVFENLIEDGDEMVCIFAVDPSKIIPSDPSKQYREKAENFLKWIIEQNILQKKISLVLELSVGKVQDMFKLMIQIYEPSILVVGTRGRSMDGFKGLLPGSVSKYCLQHSPIPVIVVREHLKREKRKAKRAADPSSSRRLYREALLSVSSPGSSVKYYSEGSSASKVQPKLPFFLEHPVEVRSSRVSSRSPSTSGTRSRSISKDRRGWLKVGDGYFSSDSHLAS